MMWTQDTEKEKVWGPTYVRRGEGSWRAGRQRSTTAFPCRRTVDFFPGWPEASLFHGYIFTYRGVLTIVSLRVSSDWLSDFTAMQTPPSLLLP